MNGNLDINRHNPDALICPFTIQIDLMLTTITTLSALTEISMIAIKVAHPDVGSKRIAQPRQRSLFLQLPSDSFHIEVKVGR